MGLILEEDGSYGILTDILGDEDHLGDMDFKVAGTENGITSLQMDIKVAGITPEIMEKALAQAKEGRMHILGEMAKAITSAGEFSVHAPRIETMQIPTDKIREVIGVTNIAAIGGHPAGNVTDERRTIRTDQMQDDRSGRHR